VYCGTPKVPLSLAGLDSVRFGNSDPDEQSRNEKDRLECDIHSFDGVGVIIRVAESY